MQKISISIPSVDVLNYKVPIYIESQILVAAIRYQYLSTQNY